MQLICFYLKQVETMFIRTFRAQKDKSAQSFTVYRHFNDIDETLLCLLSQ